MSQGRPDRSERPDRPERRDDIRRDDRSGDYTERKGGGGKVDHDDETQRRGLPRRE